MLGLGLAINKNKAVSGEFSPDQISNLELWLESDMGVTLNGSNVAAWADQSSNGNNAVQATAANQPAYVTNQLNGLGLNRFDGSQDHLFVNMPPFSFVSAQNLPDGSGGDTGKGFTCTGLAYDSISESFWIGNDGRNIEGDTTHEPSIVNVSKDGSTKLSEILINPLFPAAASIQGVTVDTSDNTLWLASLNEGVIRHISKSGEDLGDHINYANVNGLTYVSSSDTFWVGNLSNRIIQRINKSGGVIETIDLSSVIQSSSIDHLFFDGIYLWVSHGANNSPGIVDVIDLSSLKSLRKYTLSQADAIEGIYADSDYLYVCSDGYYHNTTTALNRLTKFNRGGLYSSISFFVIAKTSALTGTDCIISNNDPVNGNIAGAWGLYQTLATNLRVICTSSNGTSQRDILDFTSPQLSSGSILSCTLNEQSKKVTLYVNGATFGTLDLVTNIGRFIGIENFYIGATKEAALDRHYNGDIAAILVYSKALSTQERQSVEQYLSNKYDIALS